MKLLLISDLEMPQYWEPTPEDLRGVDLILSAGDLKPEYLNRLARAGLAAPERAYLLYVYGNHDQRYPRYLSRDSVCVDGDLLTVKGLRILGLGGSLRYKHGPYQYTEDEMQRRVAEMEAKLRRSGGADIVLTHVPPLGLGDREDPVHRGFACFRTLLETWKPAYMIHGHIHLEEDEEAGRIRQYGESTIINACGSHILEL